MSNANATLTERGRLRLARWSSMTDGHCVPLRIDSRSAAPQRNGGLIVTGPTALRECTTGPADLIGARTVHTPAGRPRAGEQQVRRYAALDAELAELVVHGLDGTTMQAVAVRAGRSKQSLYTWFSNRDGLLAALIPGR